MIPPLQRGWLFHENRNNYFSPFDFILNQFDDQLYILCNEFVPGNDNHGQHKSDDKWGQRFWTILLGSFFSTLWQKVNVQSSARLWSPHLSLRGVTLPGINLTKTRAHETNCRESIDCLQKSAQMRMLLFCRRIVTISPLSRGMAALFSLINF